MVYVLIPVFNRLALTQDLVACLGRQREVAVTIVIVDDGSTDGTAQYLATRHDLMTLKGDGQLWWAGAIDLALRTIHPMLLEGDFFLFLNNDTRVDDGYVAALVAASQAHGRAVVGSIVREGEPPNRLLDIGPRANLWTMKIWDIVRDVPESERAAPRDVYEVDFLPGRGTLYPAEALDRAGFMRPRLLPHYHADYEFADRVRRAGFRLLVTSRAVTYSTADFGNQRRFSTSRQRWFGKGSPDNLLHRMAFFCLVGSPAQRWTALPRMALAQLDRTSHPLQVLVVRIARRLLRLASRGSSLTVVRARLLADAERRGAGRLEALQAFAAASMSEARAGRVRLLGAAASQHRPFFERLRLLFPTDGSPAADLVFLATADAAVLEQLPPADSLLGPLRRGGVLYCVQYGQQASAAEWQALVDTLRNSPHIQVLRDAVQPPGFGGAAPDSPYAHVFAARRLR